jgi:hypothetical protein
MEAAPSAETDDDRGVKVGLSALELTQIPFPNPCQKGIAMPTVPPLQTTYIHAVEYARLFLEMIDHIFPGQRYITLTETQCQMVRDATDNLLTVSKWRVESSLFSSTFGILPPARYQPRPEDTMLGTAPERLQTDAKRPD